MQYNTDIFKIKPEEKISNPEGKVHSQDHTNEVHPISNHRKFKNISTKTKLLKQWFEKKITSILLPKNLVCNNKFSCIKILVP